MPGSTSSTISKRDDYPQLLSLAVHELRTPAGVVGGYLRMLLRDTDPPVSDRQRKMIEEAEKSYARLVALVAELSEISKLDAGLVAIKRLSLDLFALVQDVAGHVHEASDRGVRLELQGNDAGTLITGDPDRLRSAFDAIFRAVMREQAGPCTVVIDRRIDTREGRSSAVILTAAQERVQTMNAANSAASGPFDDKRGGLGLALPLAKRVIEAHGGQIWSPAPAGQSDDGSPEKCSVVVSFPII
jgi:signal transduction histidine kinase